LDKGIDIGFYKIQYRPEGIKTGLFVEVQGSTQVMAGAVGNEKLNVGRGVSLDLILQTIDVSIRPADPLLVDRSSPDGVVKRKRSGVFHQLVKVIRAGYGHVTKMDPGIKLWK